MTEIVDSLEDLTPEWFTAALREGGTIDDGVAVTAVESEWFGTGQSAAVVLSRLSYEGAPGGPPSLVVKVPSQDEGARQMGLAWRTYEAEVRFYEEIAPLIQMPVPHMHWGKLELETGRFTLVLDDLMRVAEVGDAIAGATPEQLELAMRGLAGLQAPLWDSPGLQAHPWLADIGRTEMMFAAVSASLDGFAERFGPLVEPEQLSLILELAPKAPSVVERVWRPPFVVCHTDYRIDNMMFGASPEAPPLTVIDWQAARIGPPGLDVAFCLASSSGIEERRRHEDHLLHVYHDAVLEAGVDGFSFEDCRESYRRASLFPLLLLVPASLMLQQTERGDQMLAALLRCSVELVADTDAASVLD